MKFTSVRGHRLHLSLYQTAVWSGVDLKCGFEQVCASKTVGESLGITLCGKANTA